jgi:glutamine synthetase
MGQVPVTQRLGRRARESEVYSFDRLAEVDDFLDTLRHYCNAQDIPAKGAVSEFAPGPVRGQSQACERPGHSRPTTRSCSSAASRPPPRPPAFRACFMAKPFEDMAGNGLHIHLSLADADGPERLRRG